jgi:O-antigen/teichoic acid export membrane protein
MVAQGLVRALNLISTLAVARAIGPSGKGVISAITLTPSLLMSLGGIVGVSAVAFFSARHGAAGFAATLRMGSISTLVLILINACWIVIGAPSGTPPQLLISLLFGIAYLAITFGVNLTAGVLVQRGHIAGLWRARLLGATTACLATISLLALEVHQPLAYLSPPLLELAMVFAISLAAFRYNGPPALPEQKSSLDDASLRVSVWRYGKDSVLTLFPAQLHMRLDRAIILFLMSTEALGAYSAALSWSSAVFLIGSALGPSLLSSNIRRDQSEAGEKISALLRLRRLAVIVGATTIMLAALAPVGVPLLFGAAFHSARTPTVILTCAFGVRAIKSLLHEYARSIGIPALGRRSEIAGLVVGMLLTPALGLWIGLTGIAIGVLMSFLVVAVSMSVSVSCQVPHSEFALLPPLRRDMIFIRDSLFAYLRVTIESVQRRSSPSRQVQ